MNKDLIRKRFAKNLKTYNESAKIQKEMAQKLISLCDQKEFDNILEIGCGTGFLTGLVVNNYSFKNYTANDIVPECEKFIHSISNRVNFVASDIEILLHKSDTSKYDLIISNAAFQWIEDIDSLLVSLYERLNSGGILLFSTFGKKNYFEIYKVTGKSLNYKTTDDYDILLKNYLHKIDEDVLTLIFDNPTDVLRHIKRTGVNAIENVIWTKSTQQHFEKTYSELCKGKFTLTYNPIYVKIEKR